MFVGALVVFIGSLVALGVSHQQGVNVANAWLIAAAIPSGAFCLATLLVLLNRPDATRNWLHGSFIAVVEEPHWIAWTDWSPHWTRVVSIDGSNLHLVRKTLFGLVTVGRVDRPITDFYRVAADAIFHESDSGRGRHGSFGNSIWREHDVIDSIVDLGGTLFGMNGRRGSGSGTWTYRLALVDRHANELTLLTASDGLASSAEEVVGRIRARLQDMVGIDRISLGNPLKTPVVNDGASGPGVAAPEKPHALQMACPNCHRRFALYVKECPGCKVALFQD